jgi:hypothetical protein
MPPSPDDPGNHSRFEKELIDKIFRRSRIKARAEWKMGGRVV